MEISLDNYKLSCELLGHNMDVRSVAGGGITADGQIIISGSRDKTAKIWKPSGNVYIESISLEDHKNFISCVLFLEDEQLICTASNDATVCIYKESNYQLIHVLKGHESNVCSIESGVEPMSIITGSWDKTARIWTIRPDGAYQSLVLTGHEAAVWTVACVPSLKRFITGSADKKIFYWNTNGEKLRALIGHTDCVRNVLGLNDGSVISCANDATIRYWNKDGEFVKELCGHTNYIYSIAQNKALGEEYIVSCGEDGTLRMWNLKEGVELGSPIIHPAQSIWSVACLNNGDIITGSSDGIARVFTKDPARAADKTVLNAFKKAVDVKQQQINENLGGIKKTDLPGPELLNKNGTREGQTIMIRHPDGSIKCYKWQLSSWNLIGDVTGAYGGSTITSAKKMFEGKEYDFVFSVDISDAEPPIKLPYNRDDDPWRAAQAFIHNHNLPQSYLDQIANFIIKNSEPNFTSHGAERGYQDPFTGTSRYVPHPGGDTLNNANDIDIEKHFPTRQYVTLDNFDPSKILDKLKEFNSKLPNGSDKISDKYLEDLIKLTNKIPENDRNAIEALRYLLCWPNDFLFPVLDVVRLAIRNEAIFVHLNSLNFLELVIPKITTSAPNQLMVVRCLTNMISHEAGRKEIERRLDELSEQVMSIKNGSANLQIAIATFYLNLTTTQVLDTATDEKCRMLTDGVIELLKWALDLEACYRSLQALGNLTVTPFRQRTIARLTSIDSVVEKIRELTNSSQSGSFAKLKSIGADLLKII